MRVEYKFSQSSKSYLGQDTVHKFIINFAEEITYSIRMIKNYFDNELVLAKEADENLESSTTCWICNTTFFKGVLKHSHSVYSEWLWLK